MLNKQSYFRCPANWIDGEELGCFLLADEGMISFLNHELFF